MLSKSSSWAVADILNFKNYKPRLILSIFIIFIATSWVVLTGYRLVSSGILHRAVSVVENFQHTTTAILEQSTNHMMASAARIPYTVNSTGNATGLFIFLHGLGDSGQGWCSMFDTIKQNNVKYVFPNAESMPVTLNMKMVMPSWFDIASLNMSGEEDEDGIKKAALRIRTLIKKEQTEASIPSNRVILGGFSMGGALALYTGLTHTEQLGGLVLLSSWLPLREKLVNKALATQKCPIFQGHGDADPLVLTKFGRQTYDILSHSRKEAWKCDPKAVFKTYRGLGHSSCDEEMKDVAQFVSEHLS